tara:strand:+ start:3424 stop:3861 length:438 start_codon:yes stop_codon:yes gene_type:complete
MRVSNIDTLSAYFDRLISERIKLYHFETKYKDKDGMEHQQKVVDEIKLKILDIFIECLENSKYDYVGEKRTFGQERIDEVKKLIDNVEKLTVNDLDVGSAYYEQKEGNSSPQQYMDNELKLREANENRSASKNKIDKAFQNIVEE